MSSAVAVAGGQLAKSTRSLLERLLGPTFDVLGEALAERTEARMRNLNRIAEKATRKAEAGRMLGLVNARVAERVIADGSVWDDELAAEYYSGLLAGSRTIDGRDDRAVYWASVVSGMSSTQLRLHFILYRELVMNAAPSFAGSEGRFLKHSGSVERGECASILSAQGNGVSPDAMVLHARVGLDIQGLGVVAPHMINKEGKTKRNTDRTPSSDHLYPIEGLTFEPTQAGLELFSWVFGTPDAEWWKSPPVDALGLGADFIPRLLTYRSTA
jgi:hypothetical protein